MTVHNGAGLVPTKLPHAVSAKCRDAQGDHAVFLPVADRQLNAEHFRPHFDMRGCPLLMDFLFGEVMHAHAPGFFQFLSLVVRAAVIW